MEKKVFSGQTYDIYTMADWERDKTLKVKPRGNDMVDVVVTMKKK